MLSVEGLHAGYGRIPILDGISMTVASGEFVGVLGHNGMGKTTLLRTLMGYIRATRGRIAFEGADITALPPERRVRRGIGYVPQGREIFPGLSVRDNLRLSAVASGRRPDDVVPAIVDRFPRLAPLLDRIGGALSGGEQQLLAIARCLCGDPKLVLLDEPTEGIQPSVIDEIVDHLRTFRDQTGLTVVLVEQNLDFIRALSQRVLIIHRGRITREVAPEHLADPEVVAEFVGVTG